MQFYHVQVLKDAEYHLTLATKERSLYNSVRETTRTAAKDFYTTPPLPSTAVPPLSGPDKAVYSFDYAQQVCCNVGGNTIVINLVSCMGHTL